MPEVSSYSQPLRFNPYALRSDCYEPQLEFSSEDPADPTKIIGVLTLMLVEESSR
jgi:hypothetical protein